MTQYLKSSFSVHMAGDDNYRNNHDAIFGKKTSDIRKQVEDFHTAFSLPIATVPAVPEAERVKLRLRLIAEEFCELLEAHGLVSHTMNERLENLITGYHPEVHEVDLVEVADACADLDYVIEGLRLEYGINGAPIAVEVHRSNKSKLDENGRPLYRDSDRKVIKGPNFSPPDIRSELKKQGMR